VVDGVELGGASRGRSCAAAFEAVARAMMVKRRLVIRMGPGGGGPNDGSALAAGITSPGSRWADGAE
jgi:hypothetical protein